MKIGFTFFARFIAAVCGFCSVADGWSASSPAASAGDYPSRPVRLIVPFPPGGGADFMGRLVAMTLSARKGYAVVVDNRGGAGGAIGADMTAKAAPDGYTLVLANNTTHVVVVVVSRKPPFDPLRDFTPISLITYAPQLLVASTVIPVRTVGELIALARAKPGTLNYASSGQGSQTNLAMELLLAETGLKVSQIPYKGTGQGFTALMGGEAHFMFVSMPAAMPHVQSGRIRALAITGAKRSTLLPGMPTLAESGVRGFEINPWFGVLGPAGLPAAIVRKLHDDIVAEIRTDETKQRLVSQGAEAAGSTPEEFATVIKKELALWGPIVERLGLRGD